MSIAVFKAQIAAGLRWLISAKALLDRPDRAGALWARAEQLPQREADLRAAYASALELLETDGPADFGERLKALEADYDQCQDVIDDLHQGLDKLRKAERGARAPLEATAQPATASVGRLPTLHLPSFDGTDGQWLGFSNLFDSLVDARQDIQGSQKLMYLMSSLGGGKPGRCSSIFRSPTRVTRLPGSC